MFKKHLLSILYLVFQDKNRLRNVHDNSNRFGDLPLKDNGNKFREPWRALRAYIFMVPPRASVT